MNDNFNIEEILEDLYLLDPVLRSEEAELKDIINKLLSQKPDAEADEEFKSELKAELLKNLAEKDQDRRRAGFFVVHRRAIVSVAGIAAALIIVLTLAVQPGLLTSIMSPDKMMASEQAFEKEVPEEAVGANSTAVKDTLPTPPESTAAVAAEDESTVKAAEGQSPAAPVSEPAIVEHNLTMKSESPQIMSMPVEKRKEISRSISEMDDFYAGTAEYEAEEMLADMGKIADSGTAAAEVVSGEEYKQIAENSFIRASEEPLSTFSIDVDTASYSNVRRFLNNGMLPDPNAVRIEELLNYFDYDYPQPVDDTPFSFTSELAECPWNRDHRLLHIGLQGYDVPAAELPPTNLVFLLDSSGSMQDDNKLPLLKESISLLIDTLRPEDRISIVAYAGSAGLVLPPTSGTYKKKILSAIDKIEAGGSTAGGAGIALAYSTAAQNLFEDGNNRVIIATDGDFNVGQSSEEELKALIEARRDQGIYLTVLGLGMGNYKDAQMEALADNGNGNYAYIDTIGEAEKVLITEMSSTLLTIAKDVKIQIDFNPAVVDSYRLIGYENRVMAAEDFDNDKKDAGEIGAGHSVTALYEIIPAEDNSKTDKLATLKFRYKNPDETQSLLVESEIGSQVTANGRTSDNFRFSAAVAEWGLVLKGSKYAASANIDDTINQAKSSLGQDRYGYRAEFIELLNKTKDLIE